MQGGFSTTHRLTQVNEEMIMIRHIFQRITSQRVGDPTEPGEQAIQSELPVSRGSQVAYVDNL